MRRTGPGGINFMTPAASSHTSTKNASAISGFNSMPKNTIQKA
jgi:hypothetical protein